MIVGHLDKPETYAALLQGDAWKIVFDWARTALVNPPADGEYPLRGRDVRALVQTVQTKLRSEGVFEAHRREVDVHVCLEGSEIIERAPIAALQPRTEYNGDKDYALYDFPAATQRLDITPGTFTIFFPEDGHMPGLNLQHPQMRKIVFKVQYDLVR